ncbi:MAG: hypothetical protein A3D31_04675 [Candidatus Fluviicola riflensis]|nr:MAG: hypothetical protein CHH17_10345 [Candidatus Fluviicola riflensis]OGS79270.1 MAG: hypothetical protein A3D31_04675 [Candidatus Fluviicola riflensis]OGS86702.1 MAG: hypothetical protein A2724_04135 [Fluviicola sp. RIFCSPHIGHO2_01_FULL_43_53]OGS88824.1 MAG: hypothetical protein A3E30_00525 [Fluviicola sp. RIFCSPHIGHO2_12_FULL_43_24]
MKSTLLFIGLVFIVLACNNSAKEPDIKTPPDSNQSDNNTFENPRTYVRKYALWEYQYDSISGRSTPVKLRSVNKDTLSAKKIVAIVNKTWPNVQVTHLRTSKDTIYLSIPKSDVLTQQMGTLGADEFMISTTYSFTELNGIRYVSFDFQPGDHANPGVYSRNYWIKHR